MEEGRSRGDVPAAHDGHDHHHGEYNDGHHRNGANG
jgi:hypothetical protein